MKISIDREQGNIVLRIRAIMVEGAPMTERMKVEGTEKDHWWRRNDQNIVLYINKRKLISLYKRENSFFVKAVFVQIAVNASIPLGVSFPLLL